MKFQILKKRSKFINNMSWMVGGKIFRMILALFINMYTARYLGPSNFGIIGYVTSYVAFFASLCSLGLDGIIVNELVKHPNKQGEYIFTSIVMRFGSSLMSIIALQLLMFIIHPGDSTITVITFLSSISLLFGSFDIITYWYQSKLNSKISVIISTMSYVVVATFKIYLLYMGKSVVWFALASTLDIALISILLVISYFKFNGQRFSFSIKVAKSLISQSYHFVLSGVMVAVFAQTDKIMIGQFLNTTEVGYYSAALTICGLWAFIPGSIIDSARPVIMQLKLVNEKKYIQSLKQLYCALIWVSIFFGVFIFIFAEYIIILFFGDQYISAVQPLRIAIGYCAFSYLGSAKNIWLICEGKQKYEKWFTVTGALINIVLNFLLIPLMGISGAAVATLVTQATTNFILPLIPKETRNSSIYMIEALIFRGIISFDKTKND